MGNMQDERSHHACCPNIQCLFSMESRKLLGARTLIGAGVLALLLLGARTLLGAPGLTTRSKKLLGAPGIAILLEAPGLTTRSKKLLGAPGIAIRRKDATRGSWPYY